MLNYSLTYIYHDCFLIETVEAVLLFDYWKDPLANGKNKNYPPLLNEIDCGKPIYIIVSHHHKDHFTRRIFLWAEKLPGISYIISHDVYNAVKYMFKTGSTYRGFRPDPNSVKILAPGEIYEDSKIKVTTFASTDIGNSYAIEVSGLKIFHAGDLNAWLWLDESTEKEAEEARNAYCSIIQEIKKSYELFDIVMFPVDSRLGRKYWWGAHYFVRQIQSKLFVPMHFELVMNENDKEKRRLDAGSFNFFEREDFGSYLQLAYTRSRYVHRNCIRF